MQLLSEAPRAVCIEFLPDDPDWTLRTANDQIKSTSTGSSGSSSSNTSLTTTATTESSLSNSKYSTASNNGHVNMERTIEYTNHNGIKSTTTTTTFSTSSSLTRQRGMMDSAQSTDDMQEALIDLKNSPFGRAFHGYLHHSRLQDILLQDGHYLVRKRSVKDPDYILSLRYVIGFQVIYGISFSTLDNEKFGLSPTSSDARSVNN